MPVAPPGSPGDSSGDKVSYSTDAIRSVAGKILANLSTTMMVHTTTWNTIQAYLDGDAKWSAYNGTVTSPLTWGEDPYSGPDVYYYLRNVLDPHEKRLSASFDWQTKFAEALFDLADQIDEAEQYIKDGFRDPSPPANDPGHGRIP